MMFFMFGMNFENIFLILLIIKKITYYNLLLFFMMSDEYIALLLGLFILFSMSQL